MTFRRALTIALVTVSLIFGMQIPTQAHAANDLDKLAKLVPGVKKAKLKESVKYLAKKRHTSYKKELKAIISSIKKQATYNKNRRNGASTLSAQGSTGKERQVPAKVALWVGDIFVSTLGLQVGKVNFGHTGIYYRRDRILHAPGAGKKAKVQDARKVKVGVGTKYMTTLLSMPAQTAVADYAKKVYKGQKYNYMYYTNKVPDGTVIQNPKMRGIKVNLNPADRVNCSELVWTSYKKKGGIDLDGYTAGNGDFYAVFPWDIERSSRTTNYVP